MNRFLANEWDRAQSQKRGGGVAALSLDPAVAEEIRHLLAALAG